MRIHRIFDRRRKETRYARKDRFSHESPLSDNLRRVGAELFCCIRTELF